MQYSPVLSFVFTTHIEARLGIGVEPTYSTPYPPGIFSTIFTHCTAGGQSAFGRSYTGLFR